MNATSDKSSDSEKLPCKYFAFISYSRKDSKAAKWLQRRLEWFRFPVKLVAHDNQPPHPRYVRPVYRDKTNLEVDHAHYWNNIRQAIEQSRFMIVLCSPESAESGPVNLEVAHFLSSRSDAVEHIVPVVLRGHVSSGDSDECLCPALRSLGDQITDRNLPTMVPDGEDSEAEGWENGFISVASYLLRLHREVLTDHVRREEREQATRARRRAALFATLALGAAIAGILAYRNGQEAAKQRDDADAQRIQVAKERDKQDKLLWDASRADHEAATSAFDAGRHSEGIAYLDRSLGYRPMNNAALAASATHAFGINAPAWRTRSVSVFADAVICIAFSPDGRHLAIGSKDNTARVIEAATGKEISKTTFSSDVTSVSFSPDGRHVAAGSLDGTARVFEAATGKEIRKTVFRNSVALVSFSPDGRWLVVAIKPLFPQRGELRVIEAATNKEVSKVTDLLFADSSRLNASFCFDPGGHHLAIFNFDSKDQTVRVIETATGKEISKWKLGVPAYSVSFSPDGRHLAVGSGDNTVRVIEVASGNEISKVESYLRVHLVSFSPDGRHLASNSSVIEVATGKEICKLGIGGKAAAWGQVALIRFSPDGRHLAVSQSDKNTVRVIEAATGKEIGKLEFGGTVGGSAFAALSFSPDGRFLAVGNADKTMRVMEATGNEVSHMMEYVHNESTGVITAVSFSPDGRHLATGSYDKTMRVIDVTTGKEISSVRFESAVTSVSFSPDGRHLAAGNQDGAVCVFEAATVKEVGRTVFGKDVVVFSVSFSPDGRYLAVGIVRKDAAQNSGKNGGVRMIEVATAKEVKHIVFGIAAPVYSVSFSPDGRHLAAGGQDGTARVFEAATGKEICKTEFGFPVNAVVFSPEGRYVVAGGNDKVVRVSEMATGKEISQMVFRDFVCSANFSPDGHHLAVGTTDGTVSVIETATWKPICKPVLRGIASVRSMSFSPDGRHLALGGGFAPQMMSFAWFIQPEESSLPWCSALRVQSGVQLQTDGRLGPLSADKLLAAQREVTAFVSADPKPAERWQHAILKWSRMLPEERTISPRTDELIRVAVGRCLMQARARTFTEISITDSADRAPWHPLEPVSLARLEPRPNDHTDAATREAMMIRPRFLARLTLKRLRDADEKLYGRDTLAEYATWAAKIMREELHLETEAVETLAFALQPASTSMPQPLLDLKSTVKSEAPVVPSPSTPSPAITLAKVPASFRYMYKFDDPGYRIWTRSGEIWTEKSPSGVVRSFSNFRQATVDERAGSVWSDPSKPAFDIFMGNKDVPDPKIYFRRGSQDKWHLLGKMEDVK